MEFWDNLLSIDIISDHEIIIGWDLNFTLSPREISGHAIRMDPLSFYFRHILEVANPVDVEPTHLEPRLRKNRCDHQAISKHLDRFLVDEDLLSPIESYRSWIGYESPLDHQLILLRLGCDKGMDITYLNLSEFGLRMKSLEV
jgi:hypothetical protein